VTKSSGRPRRRLRAALLVVAVIAAIMVGRLVWRQVTAIPAPVVDYAAKLEALAEAHQPEGRDGWALFVDAAERAAVIHEEVEGLALAGEEKRPGGFYGAVDLSSVLGDPWDPALMEPELRLLELLRERGVLDTLADAATCPRAVRPLQGEPPLIFNLKLPELALFRGLARKRAAAMRVAAANGNDAERIAAFEQMLALARACSGQTTLIDRLVGIAITSLALGELRHELAERPVDADTGRALLEAMDRQLDVPPLSMAIEGERLSMLDVIQWSFSDDGHGDGRLHFEKLREIEGTGAGGAPGPPRFLGRLGARFLAGRAETTDLLNEFFDGAVLNAELSPVERVDKGFDESAFMAKLGFRHVFINLLMPAISKFAQQGDTIDVEIAVTRTMLAIETYRAIHGDLPMRLDELVPGVLPAVPLDPLNGRPFGYRRPSAEDGRLYDLYSLGFDGVDNSAEKGEAGISASGNLRDDGFDVLYTDPRPERYVEE
jgi:hypothetical protein